MMKMTTKELEALENLTDEQVVSAFIKYGAEMHKKGLIRGAIALGVGIVIGETVTVVIETLKHR